MTLREQHKCPIWVTKQGDLVPLAIMSQRHMTNVFRFLHQKIESYDAAEDAFYHPFWGPPEGSMAEYYAEQEIDTYPAKRAKLMAWIGHFKIWFTKRGWEVPEVEIRNTRLPTPKKVEVINLPGGGSALIAELPKLDNEQKRS